MSVKAPTHHIEAQPGEIAKTVLMPGDPLRAKFIAETYLENARQVNGIRCMYAYTGTYKGKELSVMASGIGLPSMAVHAWELYHLYDVENIIRIGTAGALADHVNVRDLVIAQGACHNSAYDKQFHLSGTLAPIASWPLLRAAADQAEAMGLRYHVGNVFSSDVFYFDRMEDQLDWVKVGALCVEMETAALYMTAARAGKQALSILTISDHVTKNEHTTAAERQCAFTNMMEAALEIAP